MNYFVYIIYSKISDKSYTGITNNIDRRLEEHNLMRSSVQWTNNIQDFDLLFCTLIKDRTMARGLEVYLKSGIGREFKNLLIKDYLGS